MKAVNGRDFAALLKRFEELDKRVLKLEQKRVVKK